MNKVDTSSWKEFRLEELFDISISKSINKTNLEFTNDSNIEFIGRTDKNEGVQGHLPELGFPPNPANTFSLVQVGTSFMALRELPWYASQNIFILKPLYTELVDLHLYIKTIINKAMDKWKEGYTYPTLTTLKNLVIKLPATTSNIPDWEYMDEYMSRILKETETDLKKLRRIDFNPRRISTAEWGMFKVGDLFEKLDLKFIADRDFNKALDISENKSQEYNLPLVNAKHNNNGIMYYGRKNEWQHENMTIDIVADGAASTGDVYPQPQPTGVLYNAYLVKPKKDDINENILLFLASIIQHCVKSHFSYSNKCTWDKVKLKEIILPIKEPNKPNYVLMDNYIKEIIESIKISKTNSKNEN